MHSDLIVMAFDEERTALKAKQAFEHLRNSVYLGILNAIVVTRNRSGRVIVHQQWELPTHAPRARKLVPRSLVEVFFAQPTEESVQKLIKVGIDETFVRNVVTALQPDSSLFLSYLWQGSLVETEQVLEALSQFKGKLFHTSFPAEIEEAILEQTKGE